LTFSVPSQSTRKLLEKACQGYQERLPGSVAEKYLLNRGITKEVQTYFRLGFVGVSDPFPGHEFQLGRLVIPYVTPTGVVQMRFRAVPDDGVVGGPEPSPKYQSEAGSSVTMFNVRAFSEQSDQMGITEGELDAMSCRLAELPAVGIPGATNWRSVFARAFRYRKVVILADNDDKGEGKKFAETVQRDIRGSRIIMMPAGYDVNKFVMEEGPMALKERVKLRND
jgi:DNA primase